MAENSGISWTDHTFNPFMGCTKVSPACKNCYAERDFDHRLKKVQWGPSGTRVVTSDAYWQKPILWNRQAEKNGKRPRVFCASLADVFEDWQGPMKHHATGYLHRSTDGWCISPEVDETRAVRMNDVRDRLFALIDATPHIDWLLLTKRPENIARMWPVAYPRHCMDWERTEREKRFRGNVWIGTSVEHQEYADKRIPDLLKCRNLVPVLFLSCEPLLGPVNLHPWLCKHGSAKFPDEKLSSICDASGQINWVIAGGESGPEARPSHPDWFRSLRDQCQSANVPFHFKQWGEYGHSAVNMMTGMPSYFRFTSHTQWVNKASSHLIRCDVCMDANGKICRIGKDFAEAVYPITVASRIGTKAAGRLLDGCEWNEIPALESVQ